MRSGYVVLSLAFAAVSTAFKPVVMLHGLDDNFGEFNDMITWINETHPGTHTWSIDMYNDAFSWIPLWTQAEKIADKISKTTQADPIYADGYHLMCHSQGAILCRATLQLMSDHNVDTFLSLAGPQMGIYGDIEGMNKIIPNVTVPYLYKLAYTAALQELAPIEYWHDPAHETEYLAGSWFVPVLNNIKGAAHTEKSPIAPSQFKANFLRVGKAVFFAGTADETIVPYHSSQFGFYDENLQIQDHTQREEYISDTFGLRSLDERGGLLFETGEGLTHMDWTHNRAVYDQFLEKYLS